MLIPVVWSGPDNIITKNEETKNHQINIKGTTYRVVFEMLGKNYFGHFQARIDAPSHTELFQEETVLLIVNKVTWAQHGHTQCVCVYEQAISDTFSGN